MSDRYLVWSHEHSMWWGPGGNGYTSSMAEAGRYSRERALEICLHAIPGTADRMGALPELPVREDDALSLRESFLSQYPEHGGRWA